MPRITGTETYFRPELDEDYVMNKMFERAYSPEEFDRLPDRIKGSFYGYMGYLNAFASKQKAKKQEAQTFGEVSAGRYEPIPYVTSTMTSDKQKTVPQTRTMGQEKVPIPPTHVRRDIYGRAILSPAGMGIRRDISGQIIPEAFEGVRSAEYSKRAIPSIREEEETAFLKKQAERIGQEGLIAFPKRQEALLKSQQAQEKIKIAKDQGQQKIDQRTKWLEQDWDKMVTKFGQEEAMIRLRNKLDKERDLYNSDLNIKEEGLKQQFREAMNKLDFIQAIELANHAAAIAETDAQRDYNRALALKLEEHRFGFEKLSLNPELMPEQAAPYRRAAVTAQSKKPTATPTAQPIRTLWSKADFISVFQTTAVDKNGNKLNRPPTEQEIENARGKYWQ